MSDTSTSRIDRRAIAEAIPLFLPAIPFGFVLGLAVTEGEMPVAIGWATSPLIFAGVAQPAVIMLAGTASFWAVVMAGFVINPRHGGGGTGRCGGCRTVATEPDLDPAGGHGDPLAVVMVGLIVRDQKPRGHTVAQRARFGT